MIKINEEIILNEIVNRFKKRKEELIQRKIIGKRRLNAFDAFKLTNNYNLDGDLNKYLSNIYENLSKLKLEEDFKTYIYDLILTKIN